MTALFSSTVDTPVGPFTTVVDADGAVLASGWTPDHGALVPLIHPRLRAEPAPRKDLGAATTAVRAYHEGDLTAPDTVAVRQLTNGTFLPTAWEALRQVKPGETVTYTELALRAGRPDAVRAAAQACARNAAAVFVPCHRVVRTDGSLGGFRWGPDVKAWLIDYEK